METYNFFTKYYDKIVRGNGYSLDDEVDLLIEFIKKFGNNCETIFELACGTGVVAKKLEEKGYKVSGLDISENMLKKAQKNLGKEKCFLGDMTDFNLENKVDVILCNYNSICHLIYWEDWKKTFKNAFSNLNKKGLFIFDINTIWEFENITRDFSGFYNIGKDSVCLEMQKIKEKNFSFYRWIIKMFIWQEKNNYKLIEEKVDENSFEIKKIKKGLEKIGFKILHLEDFHKGVVDKESERVYFIAQKL